MWRWSVIAGEQAARTKRLSRRGAVIALLSAWAGDCLESSHPRLLVPSAGVRDRSRRPRSHRRPLAPARERGFVLEISVVGVPWGSRDASSGEQAEAPRNAVSNGVNGCRHVSDAGGGCQRLPPWRFRGTIDRVINSAATCGPCTLVSSKEARHSPCGPTNPSQTSTTRCSRRYDVSRATSKGHLRPYRMVCFHKRSNCALRRPMELMITSDHFL